MGALVKPIRRLFDRLPLVSLGHTAEIVRSAVWLVPTLCVAGAILLAIALIFLDSRVHPSGGVLLFPGPPGGARSFLSAIVQSMIAFTGVVFSITIVVLQLSSSQFSPRVLRNFLRDRTIRLSLGGFIATFVYALVVLRAVKGGSTSHQANFVPRFAVTGAFVLVLVTVALFIAYISHVSNMIRVANIISSIGDETRSALERLPTGDEPAQCSPRFVAPWVINSPRPGVVVSINPHGLVVRAREWGYVVRLTVRVGDFVPEGAPLIEVDSSSDGPSEQPAGVTDKERTRRSQALVHLVAFDSERLIEQDVAFGLRQLVDIALQALSPSVNAPTTAAQVLDEVHDLLRRISTRRPPSGRFGDDDGTLRLIVPQYQFGEYLDFVMTEVWHYGREAPQIRERIARLLDDLVAVALPDNRASIERWRHEVRPVHP